MPVEFIDKQLKASWIFKVSRRRGRVDRNDVLMTNAIDTVSVQLFVNLLCLPKKHFTVFSSTWRFYHEVLNRNLSKDKKKWMVDFLISTIFELSYLSYLETIAYFVIAKTDN